MSSKMKSMQKELKALSNKGYYLYLAMISTVQGLPDELEQEMETKEIKLPNFKSEYEPWYSEALAVVKQLLPDRQADFQRQYKDEKRKQIDFITYGISDYLLGVKTTRGYDVVADASAAISKMQIQHSIIEAAEKRFESSLFDIQEVLQADIFDSELEAATELAKKGFVRGAGAIAGVVLEKHLGHVCEMHSLKTRKKHPTISDFYQLLKDGDVINTAQWRFIQHLGDLRNLCDHNKKREPTKQDVQELIEGVEKIIKTVF